MSSPVCCDFFVDYEFPQVTILVPEEDGMVTSCEDQGVVILFQDLSGVDWSTVDIMVDGVHYNCDSPEGTCRGDTFFFNPPPGIYDDCEWIDFAVVSAADVLGNAITGVTIVRSFLTDFSGPYVFLDIDSPVPVPGGPPVSPIGLTAQVALVDECSEVDPMTIRVQVCNLNSGICDTFTVADPALSWFGSGPADPGWIYLEFVYAPGFIMNDQDTIEICVLNAGDNATSCLPNAMEEPYCWRFYIDALGPQADMIYPLEGQVTTCNCQNLKILLEDPAGVNEGTIELEVDGTVYSMLDGELFFVDGPLIDTLFFICGPSTPRNTEACDTILVRLLSAIDSLGNNIPDIYSWQFIMDHEGPYIEDFSPVCGSADTSGSPQIRIAIRDDCGYTCPTETELVIELVKIDPPSTFIDTLYWGTPGLNWATGNPGTLLVDIGSVPGMPRFEDLDTIFFCLLDIADSADIVDCYFNHLEDSACCWFNRSSAGPTANLLDPAAGACISCEDICILLEVYDRDGVDASTIVFEFEGEIFTIASSELSYDPETETLRFCPSRDFSVCDEVEFCLLEANDMLGTPMASRFCRDFRVDLRPPAYSNPRPTPGIILESTIPMIRINVQDTCCGVRMSSLCFTITTPSWTDTYCASDVDDSSVYWVGDVATWNPVLATPPRSFNGGDSVEICMQVTDATNPLWCPSNLTEYCWHFFIASGAPVAYPIFPTPGLITACPSVEQIIISVRDTNGVVPESLILAIYSDCLTDTFHFPDATLSFDNDTLRFTPPIPLDGACECTVTVKLLQTADVLNNLGSMSPFSFVIDHSAPEIMTAIPCDEIISTISPVLGWTVQDRCSSVDDNSFWVTIEKDMVVDTFRIWTADYIYFDWRPSENQLFFSSWDDSLGGADSLYYCLYVSDLVDTCDANEADTCCWIRIAGGGPVVSLLAPAESLHYGESCLPLQFNFVVFDSNGVDAPSIEILVTYCGSVDTSFVYSDPEVVFSAGSLLTFTPNLPFCDCDTILIVIDQAYDVLGNPVQLNMFSFIIDLQPPVVTQLEPYYSPSSVDSVNNQAPEIRWLIQDACAGIDSFCPEAHAFNTSRTSESFFNWDDGVFSWEGDTLVLSLIRGAFILSRDDTLHVCLTNMCDNTDSCSNPIVYDSVSFCWWWIIAQGGPICMLDSAYSNLQEICNDDCIRFIIHDDDGVDTTTVEVTVNDIPYRIGDPGIAWRQPDTVIVCPTPLWNTEIVTIGASAAEDTVGLAMASPCEWTFYVDLNGPVGNYLGPWVMPYQPVCSLFIWDYDHPDSGYPMNPVDSTTIVVSVNGMLYYVDGARDSVIPSDTDTLVYIRSESLLVYNAVAAGDTFIAGDSITICIDSAYDFTGCIPANFLEDTYCWTFTINIGDGPRAFLEFPEYAGATIACDTLFYITLRVYDPDYILVDSTKIRVASPGMDTVFVWGDPQIEFISDIAGTLFTVYVDPTLFLLADDDYLIVEVVKLLDGLGNPYAPPLSVRFYIDYASPFLNSSYPTEMQVIPEPDPVIWLELLDDSSSVNCSTTIISINGDTIAWGDSNMWWNDDTLYYNTGESFEFRGGDTIEFCLIDIADIPYLCSPNHLPADTCWYFIIGTGGPFAEIIRPDSNSVTACSLQQVIVTITDTIPGGIRESTIVMVIDGETINYGDPRFTWIPAGTLYYDPVEPFSNGDTICVQLVSAMDSAFNPLENPLDWCFVVDLTPPLADTYSPLPDTAILNWEQEVCLRIYDEVSTLNDTLFYFTVYGNLYTLDSAALSWDSASSVLCFDPLLADTAWTEFETIDIEVWACDMATYCPPNCTTFSWSFTIGDDDTLPPDCAFFPCTTYAESTFIITVVFDDTSGIFDDDTDTTGQGIFLIYDLDGTVDFATGDYAQIMQMELQADGVTAISGPLGGFAETDTFVYMIRVCDNDFDFSNSRDRSCTFCGPGSCTIVNNEPPQWMIISPEDESYYSCCPPEVQEIIVWIYDPNGIRESSCTLMVNDSVYVSGVDADLSYDRVSNYLIFNPGEPWMNGDTLCCLLYGVEDNFGNALRDTLNWCFIVDCSSPVVFQVTPPESAFVLLEEIEDVRIHMEDSLCGIERDSLIFRVVVGEEQWEFIGLNPLYFERDTLVFPLPMSGVVYDRGDTLEFTLLQLCDCAEGCGANCISDSVYWWVFIKPITDCSVNPNPFTPNGDGYNDETSFDYPKRFDRDAEIEIYDIKGIHIRTLKPDHFRYIWDGTDKNGRDCRQGTYVYVVKAEGKEVCSGTVILAR
ncbi:gliding motility-associated C-terminal domain-containing protein [bacterium]|nr:gliding motility-associated C-terminal domain-containing protein [bacterium]